MSYSFLIAQSVYCHLEIFLTIQNRTSVLSLKMKVSFENYRQQARLLSETPFAPHKHTNTTTKQENYCKRVNLLQISYAGWNWTAFAVFCSPETTLIWGQIQSQKRTTEDQCTFYNGNKDGETLLWSFTFLAHR